MNDNFIRLDNGGYIYNDYGKYRPDICWVLKELPIRECEKYFHVGVENDYPMDLWSYPNLSKDNKGEYFVNTSNDKVYMEKRIITEGPSLSYIQWEEVHANDFNLEGRSMKAVRGKYWVSKKGTNCFQPLSDGPHCLVAEEWGHGGDRGDLSNEKGFLYYKRAASNGGGMGTTWAVIPVGWRNILSADDI